MATITATSSSTYEQNVGQINGYRNPQTYTFTLSSTAPAGYVKISSVVINYKGSTTAKNSGVTPYFTLKIGSNSNQIGSRKAGSSVTQTETSYSTTLNRPSILQSGSYTFPSTWQITVEAYHTDSSIYSTRKLKVSNMSLTITYTEATEYITRIRKVTFQPDGTTVSSNNGGTATVNGESLTSSFSTVLCYEDQTYALAASTTSNNYLFMGWYNATAGTQLSSATSYSYSPTAEIDIEARFREKASYNVSVAIVNKNGQSDSSRATYTGNGTYLEGNTYTISISPNSGFALWKWDDGNTSSSRTFTANATKTHTIYLVQKPYCTSSRSEQYAKTAANQGFYTYCQIENPDNVTISSVQIPTWSDPSQTDMVWKTAQAFTPISGYPFNYYTNNTVAEHDNLFTPYTSQAYITVTGDSNGPAMSQYLAANLGTFTFYFDLTVDCNNGDSSTNYTITQAYNSTYTLSNPTPPDGYTFSNWSLQTASTSGSISGSTFTFGKSNATIQAVHTKTLTNYFYYKDPSSSAILSTPVNATLTYGNATTTVTVPSITAPSGYTFLGWNTSSISTSINSNYPTSGSFSISAAITLYAVYFKTITLTYTSNDANATGLPATQSTNAYYNYSLQTVTTSTNPTFTVSLTEPTLTDYIFNGWSYNNSTYFGGDTISCTDSITLVAIWTQEQAEDEVEYDGGLFQLGDIKIVSIKLGDTNIKVVVT